MSTERERDAAEKLAHQFGIDFANICARAEGFDRFADSDWSLTGFSDVVERLAAALRSSEPMDDLEAVIEGVAVEFMEEWKHARFEHAGGYAEKMAKRVCEIMREEPSLRSSEPQPEAGWQPIESAPKDGTNAQRSEPQRD